MHGRAGRSPLAALWCLAFGAAWAQTPGDLSAPLHQALRQAALAPQALAQPQADHAQAPRLFRDFMTDPARAWATVDSLRQTLPARRDQPGEIYRQMHALGPPPAAPSDQPPPLAHPPVAVHVDMPEPLATELRQALQALALAEAWRQRAFAALPPGLTPSALLAGVLPAAAPGLAPAPWPELLPLVDTHAQHTGMRIVLAAAERLHAFVTQTPQLPAVAWRSETPWGTVLVDTTGQDNHHVIAHPYLVLDVGGNDDYALGEPGAPPRAGIKLLLDHGGNDRYRSRHPAADASAAVLGYAVLWDTLGDDDHQGTWLAQGAALLGSAAHIDDAGHNHHRATGMAQGFAFGGQALLLGSPGDDVYLAQALSQASGGPQGVALLLEPAGQDRYHLGNEVLVWPSAQLPDRNASMGQGTGFGTRAAGAWAAQPGGLALLLDAAGDDRYEGQVFAQGTGYGQGTGLLLDMGGHNRHRAAWYALGAAAHQGVGLMWAGGTGNDDYEVSHIMAMGAGHDEGVGVMVDAGGQDRLVLGDLGLGAANEGGHGVLLGLSADDRHLIHTTPCRGLGQRYGVGPDTGVPGTALVFPAPAGCLAAAPLAPPLPSP